MHDVRRVPRAIAAPAAGALLVLVLALYVGLNGVSSPWWYTADPDGSYIGSSLNIILGNHTNYLDHPGLPTQDALALAFTGRYLLHKSKYDNREAFVDEQMLHLEGTRSIYRTWAVFLFVGGAMLVFCLAWRMFRHWTWGTAAGVLFLVSPGLFAIAYRLRPDAGLTATCFIVAYLLATALERKSASRLIAAAATLGFALAFKLSAVGLIPALALAAVWQTPAAGWGTAVWHSIRRSVRRHRLWLVPVVAAWVAVCVLFDKDRLPLVNSDPQRHLLINGGSILGGYLVVALAVQVFRVPSADRVFNSFYWVLAVAVIAGFLFPASLVLDDGIQAAVVIWETLIGQRVNENIDAFGQFSSSVFVDWPIPAITIVFTLATIGALLALRQRRYWPLILTVGAFTLTALAAARLSTDYYYAPGFAVALLPALDALRLGRSGRTPIVAWLTVALAAVPVLRHLPGSSDEGQRVNFAAYDLAGKLVKPGEEVILAPLTGRRSPGRHSPSPTSPRSQVDAGLRPRLQLPGLGGGIVGPQPQPGGMVRLQFRRPAERFQPAWPGAGAVLVQCRVAEGGRRVGDVPILQPLLVEAQEPVHRIGADQRDVAVTEVQFPAGGGQVGVGGQQQGDGAGQPGAVHAVLAVDQHRGSRCVPAPRSTAAVPRAGAAAGWRTSRRLPDSRHRRRWPGPRPCTSPVPGRCRGLMTVRMPCLRRRHSSRSGGTVARR